jgi:plastocyanin
MKPSQALLGFIILSLTSCVKQPTPLKNGPRVGEIHVVEIRQMQFVPDTVHVHEGDSVRWVNKDIVDHDVTEAAAHAWKSSRLKPGQVWTLAASQSADYYCNLHQVMKGKIVVEN